MDPHLEMQPDWSSASLPTPEWPGVQLKNMNIIDLDNLYEVVVPRDDWIVLNSVSRHFTEIRVKKKRAWIYLVPTQLSDQLADATAKQLLDFATRWSQSEESRDLWTPDELVKVLQKLRKLAKQARECNKKLLYCEAS